MLTISDLGSIGEFLGVFGVMTSVFYLAIQLKKAKQASEREAAFEMLRSYETTTLTNMMYKVFSQPNNLSKKETRAYYDGEMGCLFSYMGTWESLGILVFKRQVDIELVAQFFSHPILQSWNKLHRYVDEMRVDQGRETPWEWFQWLAEQLKKHESSCDVIPAHIEFRDWQHKDAKKWGQSKVPE